MTRPLRVMYGVSGRATAIEDRVAELERARADRRPDSPIPDT
jgi:hypothetical protein